MSVFSLINNTKGAALCAASNALSIPINFTHAMITGQTGCGKTTSAILPAMDERIKVGHGMLVFDYKGVEHKKVKFLAKKHGRLKDVVMINVPWGNKINIMDDASESLLMNFFQKTFGTKRDPFWGNLAANIATKSLSTMKAICDLTEQGFCTPYIENRAKDIKPSFANLCKSTQQLGDFKKFYALVKLVDDHVKSDTAFAKGISKRRHLASSLNEKIWALGEFNDKSENFIQAFKEYEGVRNDEESQKARLFSNYTFMLFALQSIADDEMLNYHGNSISKLLNEGKIVVVNSQGLKDSAVELMLNSTLSNMAQRIANEEKVPVSIFIDEAQRVLNPSTDLHADVLREARVELILAFQNEDVLKSSLGSDSRYKELVGNLTNQYFFKNSVRQYASGEDKDFSKLKKFEYYHDGKIYKASPIFIDENDLLKAELSYQKELGIGSSFTNVDLGDNEILVYNEQLFKRRSLLIKQDIVTKKKSEVPVLNQKLDALLKRLNALVQEANDASEANDEDKDLWQFL